MLITTSPNKIRSEVVPLQNATLVGLAADYAALELTKAGDPDKTWTVYPISFFKDGTDFVMMAVCTYLEITTPD